MFIKEIKYIAMYLISGVLLDEGLHNEIRTMFPRFPRPHFCSNIDFSNLPWSSAAPWHIYFKDNYLYDHMHGNFYGSRCVICVYNESLGWSRRRFIRRILLKAFGCNILLEQFPFLERQIENFKGEL